MTFVLIVTLDFLILNFGLGFGFEFGLGFGLEFGLGFGLEFWVGFGLEFWVGFGLFFTLISFSLIKSGIAFLGFEAHQFLMSLM